MSKPSTNPYVGPRTFLKEEGHLFFGREREARDLLSLVVSQRLVLFYAQSGAGKSSIINTRLIPSLEERRFEVFPVGRVSGDAAPDDVDSNVYTYNLMRKLVQREVDAHVLAELSLSQFLSNLNTDEKGYFYDPHLAEERPEGYQQWRHALIIDQFEELFSTHPEAWQKREDFFCQLADAMQADPSLWVVLVMREDYIASLDPYAYLLPDSLRVRYYMQRLGREAALQAVKSPVEALRPYAPNVAEKLVEDLCSIKIQRPDGTPGTQPGQYVEPVQLQVVCYSLWENLPEEGTQITEDDLREVGDVNQSLGRYYAGRVKAVAADPKLNVKERSIREWFEKSLITAGGIRNMVLQEPGRRSGGLLEDQVIQALQSDLVRAEKRSGATWYELTHDRLVEPILADNKAWFDANSSVLQRQTKLWNDQGRSDSLLLRDQALLDALAWAKENEADLTQDDRDLLKASQEYQDQVEKQKTIDRMKLEQAEEQARSAAQARRLTRIALIGFGLTVVGIIAALFGIVQANRTARALATKEAEAKTLAAEAKDLANAALARELAGQATDNLNKELDLSILLGVEAYNKNLENTDGTIIPQVENLLFTQMQRTVRFRGFLATSQDPATQFQYSPDGKRIALQKKDGITLWDTTRNTAAGSIPDSQFATQYFFSRDSSKLLFLDYNGLTFWDVKNSRKLNSDPLNGHKGAVVEIVYSAGGESFAAVGENGEVTIWEAGTNNFIEPPQVKIHAFSPDGKKVAILDRLGNIKVYGMVDVRQEGVTITMEPDTVTALAFNQAGDMLAIGDKNGNIVLRDLLDEYKEKSNFSVGGYSIDSLYFSSDGKLLLSKTSEGIRTLNLGAENQASPGEPVVLSGPVFFSPNGKLFAEASTNGQLVLHDIPEGASTRSIQGTSGVFSPDGSVLAVFDTKDKTLKLFEAATGKQIGEPLPEQADSLLSMAFSRDGKYLAVAEPNGSIKIWDVVNRTTTPNLENASEKSPVTALAFSPDGTMLLAGRKNSSLMLWNQGQDTTDEVETHYRGTIHSITASPNGRYVLSVADDGTELIDLETMAPLGGVFPGSAILFSNDEALLALFDESSETGKVECSLWSIPSRRRIQTAIPCSNGQVNPTAGNSLPVLIPVGGGPAYQSIQGALFSPSGESFAAASSTDQGTVVTTLWETSSGRQIGKSMDGSPLSFSPDGPIGRVLAVYDSSLGKTTLWNASTGEAIGEPVTASDVRFSSQGTTAILIEPNGNLTVMDRSTGEIRGQLPTSALVSLSLDGKTLMAQNASDGTVAFWNTETLERIGDPLSNVSAWPVSSPDGTIIAVTTYYGTSLWDVSTSRQIGSFPTSGYGAVQFSPNGKYVLAPDYYGNFGSLWDLSTHESISLGSNHMIPQGINPFTPDGKYILLTDNVNTGLPTGNINPGFTLWDIARGRQVGEHLAGHAGQVYSGAFDPSGNVQVTLQNNTLSYSNATFIGGVTNYSFLLSPDSESYSVFNAADGSASLWSVDSPPSIPGDEIRDPDETIQTALLNPDGTTLAAATQDHVDLWDVGSNAQIAELPAVHVKQPYGVNLSRDGKFAAVNYLDGSLSLWDLTGQKRVVEPIKETFDAFSPDGRILLTSPTYQVFQLRDTSTGEKIGEALNAEGFQFTADSQHLIFYSYYGGNIRVFDTSSGRPIGEPFQGSFRGVGPSAGTIITEDEKGLTLRDVGKDMQIKSFIPNDGKTTFSLSPNGKYVAAVSQGHLFVWDIETAKQVGRIEDYAGESFNFSPDGQFIYLMDYTKGGLVLYQALDPNKRITAGAVAGDVLGFSPDGKLFTPYPAYYLFNPELTFYDSSTGEKVRQGDIRGYLLGFADEGNLLVTLKDGKRINLWQEDDLTRPSSSVDYPGIYGGVSISEDGSTLVVYGTGGILVMDLTDPRHPTKLVQEKTGAVQQVAFSPDGKLLATVGSDGIILWDVRSRQPIHTITPQDASISSMKFSPDGQQIVYLDAQGQAYEVEIGANNKFGEATQLLRLNQPCAVGFNSENQLLAAKSDGGKIQIWNSSTGQTFDLKLEGSCGTAMAFSPDGSSFAYNASDRTYIFTSDKDQKPFGKRGEVVGDSLYYYNLNFLLDNQILAMNGTNAGGTDRLYLWDVKSHSLIFTSDESAVLTSSVNGKALLLLGPENRLISVDFAPGRLKGVFDRWKEELCTKAGRNLSSAEWQQYFPDDLYHSTCTLYPPGE